ncbi:TPA: hypothetical protein OKV43_000096 [Escherichia coli]|nr:hypothetical protein [Escherichia coli]
MKQVIAIILMVLAGNAWGIGGHYHLTVNDMEAIDAVVKKECMLAYKVPKEPLAADVARNICELRAKADIYGRFDHILGVQARVHLERLDKVAGKHALARAAYNLGDTLGRIAASRYIGLGIE